MTSVFVLGLITFFICMILVTVAFSISKRSVSDREKSSPFECGFDPLGSARVPFSLRFFLLAVIFLIFDVEIVLLFPFVECFSDIGVFSYIGLFLFLFILTLGLFYEWKEGSLDWMV